MSSSLNSAFLQSFSTHGINDISNLPRICLKHISGSTFIFSAVPKSSHLWVFSLLSNVSVSLVSPGQYKSSSPSLVMISKVTRHGFISSKGCGLLLPMVPTEFPGTSSRVQEFLISSMLCLSSFELTRTSEVCGLTPTNLCPFGMSHNLSYPLLWERASRNFHLE